MLNTKPPAVLLKTWLDIYNSQELPKHKEAQQLVKGFILNYFMSLYDAEIYLYRKQNNKKINEL